jgi:hypothetical protein
MEGCRPIRQPILSYWMITTFMLHGCSVSMYGSCVAPGSVVVVGGQSTLLQSCVRSFVHGQGEYVSCTAPVTASVFVQIPRCFGKSA